MEVNKCDFAFVQTPTFPKKRTWIKTHTRLSVSPQDTHKVLLAQRVHLSSHYVLCQILSHLHNYNTQ